MAVKKIYKRETKRLIFYTAVIALPVIQFCVFYIFLNFNSIIMAFRKYSLSEVGMGYDVTFTAFSNFVAAWKTFVSNGFMLRNSFKLFACELFIALPLAVLFSYYIYKKCPMYKLFKLMLFMPQIISSIIFVILYKYLTNEVFSQIVFKITGKMPLGLLVDTKTRMGAVLFYNIWISFGVNVMMFTGSMGNIDKSLVESAKLDGANAAREFFHITFPLIWPTFTTFVVIMFTGIFTNQMHLYSLFAGNGAELSTFGYFLYLAGLGSDLFGTSLRYPSYPELAALGLMLTCMTLPVVLGSRWAMRKFGPSVN